MLHCIGYFERIGDHAVNILKVAQEKYDKKIEFSEEARQDLQTIVNALSEIMDITTEAFGSNDIELAKKVEPLEQVIDTLKEELRTRHIKRLQEGTYP